MKIYVDADACPTVKIIEKIANEYNIHCILVCDHNHLLKSESSEVILVDQNNDSADLKIMNLIVENDILITQDYGLAAIALSKSKNIINHFGKIYTDLNINILLSQRHLNQKIRASKKGRVKGPKKRTKEDDDNFEVAFENLVISAIKQAV